MATVELGRKLSCWCSIAVPPYRRAFLWLHSGWRRYEALEYLHFISWVYRFVVFVCGDIPFLATTAPHCGRAVGDQDQSARKGRVVLHTVANDFRGHSGENVLDRI